jgi:hypothetical protein
LLGFQEQLAIDETDATRAHPVITFPFAKNLTLPSNVSVA